MSDILYGGMLPEVTITPKDDNNGGNGGASFGSTLVTNLGDILSGAGNLFAGLKSGQMNNLSTPPPPQQPREEENNESGNNKNLLIIGAVIVAGILGYFLLKGGK